MGKFSSGRKAENARYCGRKYFEPDKDSLLKVCLLGKVDCIEMAGATSYSPVNQKGTFSRSILYYGGCGIDWERGQHRLKYYILQHKMGGEQRVSGKTPKRDNESVY